VARHAGVGDQHVGWRLGEQQHRGIGRADRHHVRAAVDEIVADRFANTIVVVDDENTHSHDRRC
jgi:hypothetical protein